MDTYGFLWRSGNKSSVDRLDDAPDATGRNHASLAVVC
jgi:hypothetical protein